MNHPDVVTRRLFWLVLLSLVSACSEPDPTARADSAARESADRPGAVTTAGPAPEAPNIIVVLVDDLRWDEFGLAGHPYAETPNIDRLGIEGARFSNAFHAVPLCSPNRASLLTGQYPSRHGIIDNVARNLASHQLQTFPQALQASGYQTGFLGKWHMGNDPTPRPGFDYWAALPGQGRTVDPILYENGELGEVQGYVTDILTDRALDFIGVERDEPFFLFLSHKGVHPDARQLDDGSVDLNYPMTYIPAPRHLGRYDEEVFPRRDNVPATLSEIQSGASRGALELRASPAIADVFGEDFLDPMTRESTIRRRAEMLLAIDEGLGDIMAALEAQGILDETLILFTSDNGYFFGEHGFSIERRMPYDESIRSPILVRYPPRIDAGLQVDGLALSIDVAPTVLDFAGAPIGDHIQGRSLLPLLTGQDTPWRESVLVEFYTYENPMPWLTDMDYRAVRTHDYKFIHWVKHDDELYDLASDPFETKNLIDSAEMSGVIDDLRAELGRLSLDALGLGSR